MHILYYDLFDERFIKVTFVDYQKLLQHATRKNYTGDIIQQNNFMIKTQLFKIKNSFFQETQKAKIKKI